MGGMAGGGTVGSNGVDWKIIELMKRLKECTGRTCKDVQFYGGSWKLHVVLYQGRPLYAPGLGRAGVN